MKYAAVFSLLAAMLLMYGWLAVHWWATALLAWSALACLMVSLAYATRSPWLFGKRADGTRKPLHRIALAPYGILSFCIWRISIHLGSEAPWHRVDDQLIIGRRLHAREIPPGAVAVLDLTCEFTETRQLRQLRYRCLQMLDASVADPEILVAAVLEAAAQPGPLFVHCAQGHGRTGLIAALILVARNPDLAPADALAHLQGIRSGIGLNRAQVDALGVIARLISEQKSRPLA